MGYNTAFCPSDTLLNAWWGEVPTEDSFDFTQDFPWAVEAEEDDDEDDDDLEEEEFDWPSNNDEISEFLDKYSRSGAAKGIRYVGRQAWMADNCLEESDFVAYDAGFMAGSSDWP